MFSNSIDINKFSHKFNSKSSLLTAFFKNAQKNKNQIRKVFKIDENSLNIKANAGVSRNNNRNDCNNFFSLSPLKCLIFNISHKISSTRFNSIPISKVIIYKRVTVFL